MSEETADGEGFRCGMFNKADFLAFKVLKCYTLFLLREPFHVNDIVIYARQEKVAVNWLYGHALLATPVEKLCEAGSPHLDDEQKGHINSLDYKKIRKEVLICKLQLEYIAFSMCTFDIVQ